MGMGKKWILFLSQIKTAVDVSLERPTVEGGYGINVNAGVPYPYFFHIIFQLVNKL